MMNILNISIVERILQIVQEKLYSCRTGTDVVAEDASGAWARQSIQRKDVHGILNKSAEWPPERSSAGLCLPIPVASGTRFCSAVLNLPQPWHINDPRTLERLSLRRLSASLLYCFLYTTENCCTVILKEIIIAIDSE